MAVKIRLSRTGRNKVPSYRVVVADERRKRDGRVIETVGHYNPRAVPFAITLQKDRIDYWLSKGAKPSPTVARLLKQSARPAQSA